MAGSILKEVTFTPQIFSNDFLQGHNRRIGKLISIMESLAVNGIIVTGSYNWLAQVYQIIKSLDVEDHNDIKLLLVNLEKNQKIVNYPSKKLLIKEEEYIRQIKILDSIRNFDFISGTKNDEIIKTIENIKSQNYINEGAKVQKQTIQFMEKMLEPILSYSEKIQIIDPYFNFIPIFGDKERYLSTMKIICKNLSNHHGIKDNGKIIIHTSVKAISKKEGSGKAILKWEYTNDWIEHINKLEDKFNHKIIVFIWEELKKEDEWHDRYIETNQCCISIGKGMDTSNWTDSTWSIIDPDDASVMIKKFIKNRSKCYTHLATVSSSTGLKIEFENLSKIKSVEIYRSDEEKIQDELRYKENAEKEEQKLLDKQSKVKNLFNSNRAHKKYIYP